MDFIEREKLRIEEERKKKESEEKAKTDLAKRKELELQKKRDLIWEKIGPFMDKLLQKTIEKQRQAEAEKLPDPIDKLSYHEKFRGWKWKIDWDNPRLCGHFETGEGFCENVAFDSKGKASYFFPGTVTTTTYYFTIYIKCLVDVGKMALNITAKAEEHIDSYFVEEDEHNHTWGKCTIFRLSCGALFFGSGRVPGRASINWGMPCRSSRAGPGIRPQTLRPSCV